MPATAQQPKKIDVNDPRLRSMHRELTFAREGIDAEKRTCELAFASETPVERYFGDEILVCDEKSCDLGRLRDGAPLLWNHLPEKVLGVIESVSIGIDRKARAMVRFSKNPEAM